MLDETECQRIAGAILESGHGPAVLRAAVRAWEHLNGVTSAAGTPLAHDRPRYIEAAQAARDELHDALIIAPKVREVFPEAPPAPPPKLRPVPDP